MIFQSAVQYPVYWSLNG